MQTEARGVSELESQVVLSYKGTGKQTLVFRKNMVLLSSPHPNVIYAEPSASLAQPLRSVMACLDSWKRPCFLALIFEDHHVC